MSVGMVGAVVLLVVGALTLPAAFACSDEERAVFEEFDQYEGKAEPSGNPETGSCAAYYETADSREEVFSYFEDRFEKNGWEQHPEEAGGLKKAAESLYRMA